MDSEIEYALSILERIQKRFNMKSRSALIAARKAKDRGKLVGGLAIRMISRAEVWEMASFLLEEEMEALRNGR